MLAIGRALMTNPQLILMDEPSEGLAPSVVSQVGDIIHGLKKVRAFHSSCRAKFPFGLRGCRRGADYEQGANCLVGLAKRASR